MCNLSQAIKEEGKKEAYFELVQKGLLLPAEAAEALDLSLDDFNKAMTEAGYKIPELV